MRLPGHLIEKDPQSIEPQGFDWTAYLAELDAAETVTTSTWSITPSESPASLTISGETIVQGGLRTKATLAGGTLGARYTVTNHIVTSSGVEDDRSFFVKVVQR